MNKLINNPLDLKSDLIKTKTEHFNFDISKEINEKKANTKKPQLKIEEQTERKEQTQEVKRQKTYRLPQQLISDMEKIVYMDRELRSNETTLVIKALENYVYSEEGKKIIEEYNKLKNIN